MSQHVQRLSRRQWSVKQEERVSDVIVRMRRHCVHIVVRCCALPASKLTQVSHTMPSCSLPAFLNSYLIFFIPAFIPLSGQMQLEVGRLIEQVRRGLPRLTSRMGDIERKAESLRQTTDAVKAQVRGSIDR